MPIHKSSIVDELIKMSEQHKALAMQWMEYSAEQLNAEPEPGSWSVLQCIEHLNRYFDFYNEEVSNRINRGKPSAINDFKPGWLGNYFANMMMPGEQMKKMKTFKKMNPERSTLNKDVLKVFITHLTKWIENIEQSRNIDWQKTRTSITISKMLTFRLGDTLRFVTFHNMRHMEQAERALVKIIQ